MNPSFFSRPRASNRTDINIAFLVSLYLSDAPTLPDQRVQISLDERFTMTTLALKRDAASSSNRPTFTLPPTASPLPRVNSTGVMKEPSVIVLHHNNALFYRNKTTVFQTSHLPHALLLGASSVVMPICGRGHGRLFCCSG